MKPAMLSLTLFLAMPALAVDTDPVAGPVAVADPAAFADAVENCINASHESAHPFMRGFVIEHTITGEMDGICAYSQTMPGGMRMECRLSDEGRSGLAGEFREQAQGRMSGSTGAQPTWTRECEIVTKDGKRSPMGKG